MATKSTRKRRSRKAGQRPAKPYPDFRLTPHASGKWMKRIRRRIHYFGRWARTVNGKLERVEGDGWREALELYKSQADDLHAGRTPRPTTADGLTLADLFNHFLTAKLRKLEAGEITQRTFIEYREFTDLLVAEFGNSRLVDDLAAQDFAGVRATMAKRWGPSRLGKGITCIKGVFKYGFDNGLIDRHVRYGSEFQKPGKAVLRRHKASGGQRMFEAEEVRRVLKEADVPNHSPLDIRGSWDKIVEMQIV